MYNHDLYVYIELYSICIIRNVYVNSYHSRYMNSIYRIHIIYIYISHIFPLMLILYEWNTEKFLAKLRSLFLKLMFGHSVRFGKEVGQTKNHLALCHKSIFYIKKIIFTKLSLVWYKAIWWKMERVCYTNIPSGEGLLHLENHFKFWLLHGLEHWLLMLVEDTQQSNPPNRQAI